MPTQSPKSHFSEGEKCAPGLVTCHFAPQKRQIRGSVTSKPAMHCNFHVKIKYICLLSTDYLDLDKAALCT